MTKKELVLANISDSIANLLYYDRKEDEELPRGEIEKLVQSGELTVDEMVDKFKTELIKGLK